MRLLLLTFFIVVMFSLFADQDNYRKRAHHGGLQNSQDIEDIDAEITFGKNLAARILGQFKLYQKKEVVDYFSTIGAGLASTLGRSELTYHFAILDSYEVNGYATPGGYIFVTKSALLLMENEAELVGVLAHEMSHVNRLHIVKELNLKGKKSELASGIALVITGADQPFKLLLAKLMDKGMSLLFNVGLPKDDEFEADRDAVVTLISLGYDPLSYMSYLSKLQESINRDQKLGRYLSQTHPSMAKRIESLQKFVEQKTLSQYGGKKNEERFNEMVTHLR